MANRHRKAVLTMTAGLFVLVVHASCAASERKGDEPSAQKPRSAGVLSNAANAAAAAQARAAIRRWGKMR